MCTGELQLLPAFALLLVLVAVPVPVPVPVAMFVPVLVPVLVPVFVPVLPRLVVGTLWELLGLLAGFGIWIWIWMPALVLVLVWMSAASIWGNESMPQLLVEVVFETILMESSLV